MTPIERAARELAELDTERDIGWRYYVPEARAVIMAIREPSEEVAEAGYYAVSANHPYQSDLEHGIETECWQAMIDAALNQ